MADVYVNALTTISTEPTTTDSLVAVNRNTNEGKIIDYNLLANAILNKLTSKTYSELNTTSKLLVGAINELDSDVSSINNSSTYKSGDTVNFIGAKSIGRITIAGNQAYVALQLPKAIDADSVSVTLTMANVFGVSGSTSASSFTVSSIGISGTIGQVQFAFPIQTSMPSGSVCVVEMSGSITFS